MANKSTEAMVQRIIAQAHMSAAVTQHTAWIKYGHKCAIYFGLAPETQTWHCILRNNITGATIDAATGNRDEMLARALGIEEKLGFVEECCAPLHIVLNNITRVYPCVKRNMTNL